MSGKRKIQITREELLSVLKGKSYVNLPEDADIHAVGIGTFWDIFELFISSNSYPELKIGEMVPSESAEIISVQTSVGGEEVQQ